MKVFIKKTKGSIVVNVDLSLHNFCLREIF